MLWERRKTDFCNAICISGFALSEREYNILRTKKVSYMYRNKFEIIAEILTQLRVPTGKTNIMSRCNMNTAKSGEYLNLMRSNDLIRMDALPGRVTYQRTETGREFLELYSKMALLLDNSISAPFLM
jgi:predicted transcriptional regulator